LGKDKAGSHKYKAATGFKGHYCLKNRQAALYIRQPGHRSLLATRHLFKSGIGASNVTGGLMAWINAGYPVEQTRGTMRITR